MNDPSQTNTPKEDPRERLQKSKERAADAVDSAARTVRDVAGERVEEVRETVESSVSDAQGTARARLAEVRGTAKDTAGHVRELTRERAEEGVSTAAHGLKDTAERLRDVAGDLDEKDRWLGAALEKAAGTAERAGDYMSGQNVNDIVRDAQNLARTNPAAFMGGAAAIGFALARIGKATVERATVDSHGGSHNGQGGVSRAATHASGDATRRTSPAIPTAPVKPSPMPAAGGRALNPSQSTPLHRSQT